MEDIKDFITVQQAAKMMDVTPQAIRRALKEGRIQGEKKGNMWLIHKSQFVQVNRNGNEPPQR